MNDDNGFGVPAGWYPDPLGLPQMRWWDNHGWTEHTTEARAPIVIQEAKLAWADDDPGIEELPTRREMRERERETGGSWGPRTPHADGLRELDPPSWDLLPADEPAPDVLPLPELPLQNAMEPGTTDLSATDLAGTPFDHLVAKPESQPARSVPTAQPSAQPDRIAAPVAAPSAHTPGAWILALVPILQLVATLLIVATAGSTGTNMIVLASIWLSPYVFAIPLAISDRLSLRRRGYDRPASWAWILLGIPVYLVARAIRIVMRAGNGFGPALVWSALVLLQLGSIIAVPGIAISALPQTFADEAAQSIQQTAAGFDTDAHVVCPAPPATQMGQQFTCILTRTGSDQQYRVTASLSRLNGWIAWRVDDWGSSTLGP